MDNQEIFFFDDSTTTQLTNTPYKPHSSKINACSHVAWHEYDGSDYKIFCHDSSTTRQASNNNYHHWSPQINPNDEIARHGGNNPVDYLVFLWRGRIAIQLSSGSNGYTYPRISHPSAPTTQCRLSLARHSTLGVFLFSGVPKEPIPRQY